MKVVYLINQVSSLVAGQATAVMALATATLGEQTWIVEAASLGYRADGAVVASARRLRPGRLEQELNRMRRATPKPLVLDEVDVILVRTNPARSQARWAHEAALQMLTALKERGVRVTNDPEGLRQSGNKLFLAELPPWTRPETLISANAGALVAFVRDAEGPTILKPATGTRGGGVFRLTPKGDNVRTTVELLLEQGLVVAQPFVPAAVHGDTRVLLLDGDVLELDGAAAAVQRVPGEQDFRSNVHVGATPKRGELTDGMRAVATAIGPMLRARGLRLVGVDFLGDLICEINVFAPGGAQDMERFTGRPFTRHILETLLKPA